MTKEQRKALKVNTLLIYYGHRLTYVGRTLGGKYQVNGIDKPYQKSQFALSKHEILDASVEHTWTT